MSFAFKSKFFLCGQLDQWILFYPRPRSVTLIKIFCRSWMTEDCKLATIFVEELIWWQRRKKDTLIYTIILHSELFPVKCDLTFTLNWCGNREVSHKSILLVCVEKTFLLDRFDSRWLCQCTLNYRLRKFYARLTTSNNQQLRCRDLNPQTSLPNDPLVSEGHKFSVEKLTQSLRLFE